MISMVVKGSGRVGTSGLNRPPKCQVLLPMTLIFLVTSPTLRLTLNPWDGTPLGAWALPTSTISVLGLQGTVSDSNWTLPRRQVIVKLVAV